MLGELTLVTESPNETVGARIMRLRKDKSLTQQELAERLGVSQPVVSDCEHDVIGLDSERIVQLAQNWESPQMRFSGWRSPPG